MSFPTAALIDDFTRANADPISSPASSGATWDSTKIANADSGLLKIVSNKCDPGGQTRSSVIQGLSLVDAEVFATNGAATGSWELWARAGDLGTLGLDGYRLTVSATNGTLRISRTSNNTVTNLDVQINQAIAVGDMVGMSCIGRQLAIWYRPVGGVWQMMSSFSDTLGSVLSAGQIGLRVSSGSLVDDFGGGAPVPDPNLVPLSVSPMLH